MVIRFFHFWSRWSIAIYYLFTYLFIYSFIIQGAIDTNVHENTQIIFY